MTDVATLGLKVDAREALSNVEAYSSALDRMKRASSEAEAGTKSLDRTMQEAARGSAVAGREAALANIEAAQRTFAAGQAQLRLEQVQGWLSPSEAAEIGRLNAQEYNQAVVNALSQGEASRAFRGPAGQEAFAQIAGSLKTMDDVSRSAGVGVHRLNNSLVVLARQATGAHPIVGQLTDVVGTFAIGTARMVPILAGIAAVGAAFQLLTRDAREARKEINEARNRLEDLAEAQRIRDQGGRTAVDASTLRPLLLQIRAERERLDALLALDLAPNFQAGVQAQRNKLMEDAIDINRQLAAAERELREEREQVTAEELDAITRAAEAQHTQITNRMDLRALDAQTARTLTELTLEHELQRRRETAATVADGIRQFHEWEIEQEEKAQKARTDAAERAARERARAEVEAQREAQRVIQTLARGANILGRAVGGSAGAGLSGAAGGALIGSQLGSVVPGVGNVAGAVVGGLVGAIGGLFGASKEAKEAERNALEAAQLARQALAERRRALREEIDIRAAMLGGDSDAAQLLRLGATQRRERSQAAQLDPVTREMLDALHELETQVLEANLAAARQIEVAEEQLGVLEDQLAEQERTVEALRGVVDNLGSFLDDLSLSDLSPLGPAAQLAEARRQFETLATAARGGDLDSANQLPEAARRLLELSRAFNASGPGFVNDFNLVQQVLEAVRDQFADQLSVEEQLLAELQAQRDLLEEQVREIQRQTDEANRRAAEAFQQQEDLSRQQEERDEERGRARRDRERDEEADRDRDVDDLRDIMRGVGDSVDDMAERVVDAQNRTTEAVERDLEREKDPFRGA